jgi:VIT1/CCC1 family predicted Fe2+/Mn2+ transporter
MNKLSLFRRTPVEDRLKRFHGEDWHKPRGRIIRDIVYALDTGLITMVAFMAGVSVSLPDSRHVMLAGIANACSGMLAIFFGAFISTKAQRDFFENQIERERQELEEMPEKETEEVREILMDMGFTEEEAETGVARITSNKEIWLKFMIQEEIGLVPGTTDDPLEIGLISAGSFLVGVLPAFLPFAFGLPVHAALPIAAGLVIVFLFAVGVWKTRLTKVHWLESGLETMVIGAISCGIGLLLGRLANLLIVH